jgi:sugar/nucleoside kinase (ribokinase family)
MILVCGEALIDLFVGPAEGAEMPARAIAGGSPFNVAVGLARLGVDVSFLGGISRDRFGALLARILIGEVVDDRFLVNTDRPTTISMVATGDNGQPSYSRVYRKVLASVMAYLKEMDTPDRLIEALASTSSTDMVWVKADYDLARPASVAEWIDATCQPLTSDERRVEKTLGDKMNALAKSSSKLPENEQAIWSHLLDKEVAYKNCETILLDSNREKLPKP